jgi:hypothetical protein
MRGISKSTGEVLVRLKPGDRFADEDVSAVHGRVSKFSDKRLSQHIALRPMDGFAVDTRALTALQVLRICEELCETLANVRAPTARGRGGKGCAEEEKGGADGVMGRQVLAAFVVVRSPLLWQNGGNREEDEPP